MNKSAVQQDLHINRIKTSRIEFPSAPPQSSGINESVGAYRDPYLNRIEQVVHEICRTSRPTSTNE